MLAAGWLAGLSGVLLATPVTKAVAGLHEPFLGEDIKPVLQYLSERRAKDDIVYVYYGANHAFAYYSPRYGLTDVVIGLNSRKDPEQYRGDLDRLAADRRMWLLFAHNCPVCKVDEEAFITKHLAWRRDELSVFRSGSASLRLYEKARWTKQQTASGGGE